MRLRELRRKRKLTQTQVGQVIGKSAATIHRLEKGDAPVTIADLRKLAAFFHVTVAALLKETNDKPASTNGRAKEHPHA